MNSVEIVKSLCKQRKIPISKLERDLGYGNGYIGQLRKGVFPHDRLFEIAAYLNVSMERLLPENESKPVTIAGNELDIEKILNNITDEQLADIIITAVKSRLTNERIVDIMMVAAARLKEID